MDCPRCGSDNVTLSHRRGMEKILRYVYPRVPYRCKECWSRFWKLESPMKSPISKIAICLVVLIIAAIITVVFINNRKGSKPVRRIAVKRTSENQIPVENKRVDSKEKIDKKTSVERIKVPERANISKQSPGADLKPADKKKPESIEVKEAVSKTPAGVEIAGKESKPVQSVEKKPLPVKTPGQKPESVPAKKAVASKTAPTPEKTPAKSKPAEEKVLVASTAPIVNIKSKAPKDNFRILRKIQPVASPGEFKMTVTADGSIGKQKVFFLLNDSPNKLVLDLPGKWKNPKRFRKIKANSKLVKQIRIGEHADKLRLVLDLKVKGPLSQNVRETLNGCILTLKK